MRNMSVDSGRFNRRMTKYALNQIQVNSAFQHVRSGAMAHEMSVNALIVDVGFVG